MNQIAPYTTTILAIVMPLFLALLAYVSTRATALINARVKNENLRTELLKINDRVDATVKEIAQTAVDNLKDATKDGVFTPAEAARFKAEALATVLASLGPAKTVAKNLGLPDAEAVPGHVGAKIEAAVLDLKKADAAPVVEKSALPSTDPQL